MVFLTRGLSSIVPLVFVAVTYGAPSKRAGPTVALDQGTFTGNFDPIANTNQFLGIPFAQPPYV